MLDQKQQTVDIEQELQQFSEALRQLQTCPPAEITTTYNQAVFHLKKLTDELVVGALRRHYRHNMEEIDRTGPRYPGEVDDLRRKQPMLEQTWREELHRRLSR